jgi:hypothetical protein
MAESPRTSVDWFLALAINAAIVGTLFAETHFQGTPASLTVLSALICFPLLNGCFLWAVARRNRRTGLPTSHKFLVGVSALAFVVAVGTLVALGSKPEQSDVALALSNLPLEKIAPERRRIFVELLRSRLANSQRQRAEAETMKQHPLPYPLYSPATFGSRERIDEVLDVIRQSSQSDLNYYDRNKKVWSEFSRKMSAVDTDYLEALSKSNAEGDAAADQAAETERQWYNHTVALYTLARDHAKEVQVKGDEIKFSDSSLGKQLGDELKLSESLYDKLTGLNAEQAKKQQRAAQDEGIRK